MGKMQREKGKRGEREVCKLLEGYGFTGRRSRQSDGAHDPDVITNAPWWVECKFVKAIAAERFMEQAEADAKDGLSPVVFMRSNGGSWLVMMRASELPAVAESFRTLDSQPESDKSMRASENPDTDTPSHTSP